MKRDKPICEKDSSVRWSFLCLASVLVLLSLQMVSVSSAGAASFSDSEMKYLDCASVVDSKVYEGTGELFAACNETPSQCADTILVSYYRQMWKGIDPKRSEACSLLGNGLIEPCPDLSVVLPTTSDRVTPDENGADKRRRLRFWMNGKVRGFGGGHQVNNWEQMRSDESDYPEAGIGQVSVTLAALNVGS